MIERILFKRLVHSKKSTLLLGPRQVGKTTLCCALNPGKTVNLADEEIFLRYGRDPGLLKREVLALRQPTLILLDEIQRLPPLLNTVQALMDDNPLAHRFLLTGSSARKLKRSGVNLLPGRIIREFLGPLTYLDFNQNKDVSFDLERALRLGMLPGIYLGEEQAEDVLATYADVYLREEIHHEALTKNIGAYARFLDVIAVISGSWLNYSKLCSDTEIPKSTLRHYLEILENTLLLLRISPFVNKTCTTRRVSHRERIFLFDVGVRNAILKIHRQSQPLYELGRVFEQWFILQIFSLLQTFQKDWKLFSYRTDAGAEVDLVIDRGRDVVGIEVKYSRNIRITDARGLHSLKEYLPRGRPFQPYIVYLGEHDQLLEDGTRVMPYGRFFLELFT